MMATRFIHTTMVILAILASLVPTCIGASESPSFAPSLSAPPTVSPSAAPSVSPTLSAAPSTLAPTFPPVVLNKFDWDLERTGTSRLAFTEELDTAEISLDYNISLRDPSISLFETDCSTPVDETVATAIGGVAQTSLKHANLTVNIDVIQENITSSPIWSNLTLGQGVVELCVRVDLLEPDLGVSVHFHETRLSISVNMVQGFQVDNVDIDRETPDEEDGNAAVEYTLIACQCNLEYECVALNLTQGSQALICVQSLDDGVEIVGIESLTFSQGSYSIDSIADGQVDQFTSVSLDDGRARIRNQLLSVFFEQISPENVSATGFALLGFTEQGGRQRLLRAKITNLLADEQEDASFSLLLGVKSSLIDNSGAINSVLSFTTIMIGIATLFM